MARSLTWRCCPWCLTEDEKAAARIDQEINRILLEQKKRDRGELKLLLLGEQGGDRTGTGIGTGTGTRCRPDPPPGRERLGTRRQRHRDIRVRPPRGAGAAVEVASGAAGPARPTGSGGLGVCGGEGAMSSALQPAQALPAASTQALPPSPRPRACPTEGLTIRRVPWAQHCQWALTD